MSLRPESSTHRPSYICDKITYGIGILAGLGLGGGQAYQMFTQGASSQGWTGLAGITGFFAVSSFAIIRSTMHQRSDRPTSSDVERAPLLPERVVHYAIPQGLAEKVDAWFQQLGLLDNVLLRGSIQAVETPEQKLHRQLDAISAHYQENDRVAQAAQEELARLRQQRQPTDTPRRELFASSTGVEMGRIDPSVTIKRLERDLADVKGDLESAKAEIEHLQGIIDEYDVESEIRQSYVEQLQRQFEELLSRDVLNSPQGIALTTTVSILRKGGSNHNSRNSSAHNSPSKLSTTPTPGESKRVTFLRTPSPRRSDTSTGKVMPPTVPIDNITVPKDDEK